jgi:hypothetical protein
MEDGVCILLHSSETERGDSTQQVWCACTPRSWSKSRTLDVLSVW